MKWNNSSETERIDRNLKRLVILLAVFEDEEETEMRNIHVN